MTQANILHKVRTLFHRPFLKKATGVLRLRRAFRKVYYVLLGLRSVAYRKKKIALEGYEAVFQTANYHELMTVECSVLDGEIGGEREVLKHLLAELRPGDVAFDVGASLGIHTIFMALRVESRGKVVAFEPEKGSYQKLLTNVALNGLTNVLALLVGLGEERGDIRLFGGAEYCFNLWQKGRELHQEAEIWPGDEVMQKKSLPRPNLVKIDVEGFEYFVLKGLRNTLADPACRSVCLEVHAHYLPPDVSPEMLTKFLQGLGFVRTEAIHYASRPVFHEFYTKA
jgi:FkbM family methyltransferase